MLFNNVKAYIKGGKDFPNINGIVTFKETKNGVIVTAKINGLPHSRGSYNGRFFGFHIHEVTSCSGNSGQKIACGKIE